MRPGKVGRAPVWRAFHVKKIPKYYSWVLSLNEISDNMRYLKATERGHLFLKKYFRTMLVNYMNKKWWVNTFCRKSTVLKLDGKLIANWMRYFCLVAAPWQFAQGSGLPGCSTDAQQLMPFVQNRQTLGNHVPFFFFNMYVKTLIIVLILFLYYT